MPQPAELRTAHADWLDRTAMTASLLCLAHCLALPLIFALLPTLGRVLDIPESFHLWMLALAVPASGWALVSGRAHHGVHWPLLLGGCGLALLALGAIVLEGSHGETIATVFGSICLVTAHIANWRLRHGGHASHASHRAG